MLSSGGKVVRLQALGLLLPRTPPVSTRNGWAFIAVTIGFEVQTPG
nr:putative integron gene cassette protein [uncultured bacterium]